MHRLMTNSRTTYPNTSSNSNSNNTTNPTNPKQNSPSTASSSEESSSSSTVVGPVFTEQRCNTLAPTTIAEDTPPSVTSTAAAASSTLPSLSFRSDLSLPAQLEQLEEDRLEQRRVNELHDENCNNLLDLQVTTPAKVSTITLSPAATVEVARWSCCALVTEAARYHREISSKTKKHRLFHLPASLNQDPIAFGSAVMTDMLLNDTHKLFNINGCELEESMRGRGRTIPLPSKTATRHVLDPLLFIPVTKNIAMATKACRHQLAQLDQWSVPCSAPVAPAAPYPSDDDDATSSSSGDDENSSNSSKPH